MESKEVKEKGKNKQVKNTNIKKSFKDMNREIYCTNQQ
jgi:hypothetical protein